MSLSVAELSSLSRLLDDALELPEGEVPAWLDGLGPDHARLVPVLREMLAERNSQAGFLQGAPSLGESPLDASVARAGEQVGAYRLLSQIGQGGMGAVWLAERADGSLKRRVALKLPRLAWGAGLAERMARERDIGALLEHPNIGRLYDAGVDARGRPFLALEYIDGVPLDRWCNDGRLAIGPRLRLFVQVARAAAYAHGRLVVHRDLKPANVLVTADGQVHLLDFGIAKLLDDSTADDLTVEQGRVLTPQYASPEQIEGGPITIASDVYSLGVLLYELLTGSRPHGSSGSTLASIERSMLEREPVAPSQAAADKAFAPRLRGEIDAIVMKALKVRPADRYSTAEAFADDVERYLEGERVLAQPDSLHYRARKFLLRHWALSAVSVATSIGFLVTTVMFLQVRAARAAADAHAAAARNVNDYLVRDLLGAADPMAARASAFSPPPGASGVAGAGQVPVVALLDRAASGAARRFAGQPSLEAAVRVSLGEAYVGLSSFRAAAEQFGQAARLASSDDPNDPLASASALFQAGAALREDDQPDAADARLVEAAQALTKAPASAEREQLRVRISQEAAWLLYKRGAYAEAADRISAGLPDIRRAFGDVSDESATALARLSNAQVDAGRLREAVDSARAALALWLQLNPPDHPRLIDAHSGLGDALRLMGQDDEAERETRLSYAIAQRALGPDNFRTLVAENSLASVLQQRKRYDEAIALFEDALARSVVGNGATGYETGVFMNNLGIAYADAGRTADAIATMRRSLDVARSTLGAEHAQATMRQHNLADLLVDSERSRDDWREALSLESGVLKVAPALYGPHHVIIGLALRTKGKALLRLRRREEAIASLQDARRVLVEELGAEHTKVRDVDKLLAAVDGSRTGARPSAGRE